MREMLVGNLVVYSFSLSKYEIRTFINISRRRIFTWDVVYNMQLILVYKYP
jgi:hypothetical protein